MEISLFNKRETVTRGMESDIPKGPSINYVRIWGGGGGGGQQMRKRGEGDVVMIKIRILYAGLLKMLHWL